ncbi:MAG: hypothetical protein O2960_16335 [Verrucomicrobia bacterium]|nr:hypothetical protein [Verrucomicrobiota bacterium]
MPKSQSQGNQNAVQVRAAAAAAYCLANGTPPAGYFVVGNGPFVGPKQ